MVVQIGNYTPDTHDPSYEKDKSWAGVAASPLENQCVGQAELVIDVSNQGERVSARDEVLLDYDCGSSTCPFETTSAALEHHVSGRDSSSKVHPAILDNCRKMSIDFTLRE